MRTLKRALYTGLLPWVAACGITDVQAPAMIFDEEVGEPFVEALDAAGLEAAVGTGVAEFELVLLDDGLTIGEVAVRTEEPAADDRIQSRAASFDEAEGRLVLQLGEVGVTFAAETHFWVGDEPVSRDAFASRVREDLGAGRHTPIVVERPAPASPQGPDDERFVAMHVVVGGDGTPSLRVKVGPDNLERVTNPSSVDPDTWLNVLGRHLRMKMRDGTTSANRHRHRYERVEEFSGQVASIDLEARTLRLTDGLILRVTGRTDIVQRRGYARTLRVAAEALQSGKTVTARGLAVAQEQDGRKLALRVALKIEGVENAPIVVEFDGVVVGAAPSDVGTVLSLADGTSVQIRAATEVVGADEHSPATVAELMEALADGREVVARGTAYVLEETPRVLKGVRVVLESEAPVEPTLDVVEGNADYVSSDGWVILVDGTAVVVNGTTEVVAADSRSPGSVQELMAVLDQNRRVSVRAEGTLDDAQQVMAVRVVLTAEVGTFDLDVLAVDPDSGGLILAGGSFALLTESTVITAVGNGPADFMGVYDAVATGARVRARGTGFIRGRYAIPDEADDYDVIDVEFELMP